MDAPPTYDKDRAARLGAKLRFALGLVNDGVAITRARLRRQHPDADEAAIQALLNAWLLDRPGYEDRQDLVPRASGAGN